VFSLYPSFFWELRDKKSTLQLWPESLGARLEYCYIVHDPVRICPFCGMFPFTRTGRIVWIKKLFVIYPGISRTLIDLRLAILSDGERYNQGLTSPETLIAVHACSQSSSETLQGTSILINTFTPYQIGEKAQFLRKKRHLLKESRPRLFKGL